MSKSEQLCADQRLLYYDYLNPIAFSLAAIFTLPWIVIYIQSYMKRDRKARNLTFYSGIILFIVTFTCYVSYTIWALHRCHNEQIASLFHNIALQLTALQFVILLAMLFYKLYYVFHNTELAISKCTIRIFIAMYICTFLLASFAAILFVQYPYSIGGILGACSGLLVMIMMIY